MAGKAGCVPTLETAILAGGCFWGMEEILRKIPGVIETEVGYTGGRRSRVRGDDGAPATPRRCASSSIRSSFAARQWFFRMHDPTTANRQGNDVGTQYRSAIFVTTPEQRRRRPRR